MRACICKRHACHDIILQSRVYCACLRAHSCIWDDFAGLVKSFIAWLQSFLSAFPVEGLARKHLCMALPTDHDSLNFVRFFYYSTLLGSKSARLCNIKVTVMLRDRMHISIQLSGFRSVSIEIEVSVLPESPPPPPPPPPPTPIFKCTKLNCY